MVSNKFKITKLTITCVFTAMMKRSKAKSAGGKVDQYKMVIYGFIGVVVISVLYTILFPKTKIGELTIIDDAQILVHNGMGH